jgi:hypothetical protein
MSSSTRPHRDTLARTKPNRVLVVTPAVITDDPLLEFLPEASVIVTHSIATESQCEPRPRLDEMRNASAAAARHRLLFHSLHRMVRRTCAAARLGWNCAACLLKRTAALATSTPSRFWRFRGSVTTHGRAAWMFCSVVGVLLRARLRKRLRAVKSAIIEVERHLRVVSRSRYKHVSRGHFQALVRCARRFPLSRQSLGMRTPAWVPEISKVRAQSMNAIGGSFASGIAVGALVMWSVGVKPLVNAPAVQKQTVTAETTASIPLAPDAAPVVSLSGEDRSPVVTRPRAAANPLPVSPRTAAAAVIPFRGTLAVHSGPQGARVFINGQSVGSTPLVLKGLPVGSRAVRIEAEGFRPWSASVRVTANQQTHVTAKLERDIARSDPPLPP